jgi:hypothetical protein
LSPLAYDPLATKLEARRQLARTGAKSASFRIRLRASTQDPVI